MSLKKRCVREETDIEEIIEPDPKTPDNILTDLFKKYSTAKNKTLSNIYVGKIGNSPVR